MGYRTGTKRTPRIILSRDQLAELVSRGNGIYTATSEDLDGDNPVRVEIVQLTDAQRTAALDALTIETVNGISFGLDTVGALVPGTSAWFGFIYGNADRIFAYGDRAAFEGKGRLSDLEGSELEQVIASWINQGVTPKVVK